MHPLSRLWPRTLARQLSLLLLLALLASNAIAMLFLQRTGSLIHPLSRSFSLERLGIAHHTAIDLTPSETAHLLAGMSTEDTRFWIGPTPEVAPFAQRPEEQRLANELRDQLQLDNTAAIGMQLERISGADARTHVFSPAGWAPLRLRSSVPLPNGSYLPVLLIVMFFIARVVRPIKTLAQATERVSRGEWIAPLPETGPQEARDLTAAFNTMQANLARHVEGRTRMLAAVSHDLNTPITELRLQVELLESGAARDDMLESLAELSAMVRETLNFVRDDAVQEATATLSLSDLLDDLA
jgi:methyl-accepting chemotaxis protein